MKHYVHVTLYIRNMHNRKILLIVIDLVFKVFMIFHLSEYWDV